MSLAEARRYAVAGTPKAMVRRLGLSVVTAGARGSGSDSPRQQRRLGDVPMPQRSLLANEEWWRMSTVGARACRRCRLALLCLAGDEQPQRRLDGLLLSVVGQHRGRDQARGGGTYVGGAKELAYQLYRPEACQIRRARSLALMVPRFGED